MKFYFGSNRRRHWARLIGWGTFIIFFITVCIPLLFFYYLFDATKVKQMVIDQFNSQNYSVVINGTVEPRSWHGLSLFISDLTVEDKFQHKVMHINTANCQLSWLDLIVAHYRIRRVALNGLTLYQNAMKKGNYVNLLNYQAISHSEFKKLMKLSVTNFNWMDTESNFIVKDASLQLNNLDTLPIIEVKFNLANYAATVHINGAVAKTDENAVFFDKITTSFVSPQLNAELDSHGRYDYKTQEFWFTNIKVLA